MRIIDWFFKTHIASEATGMTEKEQYAILAKINAIEGAERLLKALVSSDMAGYFSVPEDNRELRWIKKGSVLRLKWFQQEMAQAMKKLEQLNNPKEHET